ncbi:hypothetical protein CAOG_01909 [Capsaspora owczarzaki ATCC 30864]|uniref:hypothetical protein n=1 Tax=Capsaspora owczarzaki (strain ATCC 30864) TaxID=595528 RepID=UPI0001FE5E17|nr:hypothetical protein CAOG_01909 [Capsaspora owczarzaki ATCC 30864]|eukprot:XP_004364777.1 hypothetical protein CAOG_01909 [Capsaspora owczarzaki ATCC 30864]
MEALCNGQAISEHVKNIPGSHSFQTHATSMLIATTAARVAAFPLETIKIMLQTNLVPFIAAAPAAPALDSFALQAQLHPSPSYFRALPVAVPAEVMELAGTRPPPPPQPPSLSGAPGRQQGLVAFRPYWDARECLRSLATCCPCPPLLGGLLRIH